MARWKSRERKARGRPRLKEHLLLPLCLSDVFTYLLHVVMDMVSHSIGNESNIKIKMQIFQLTINPEWCQL